MEMKSMWRTGQMAEGERQCLGTGIQPYLKLSIMTISVFSLCFQFHHLQKNGLVDTNTSKKYRKSTLRAFPLREVGRCTHPFQAHLLWEAQGRRFL